MEEVRRALTTVSDFLTGCIGIAEQLKEITFKIGTVLVYGFLVAGAFVALGWLAKVIYLALLNGHA